MCQGVAPSAWPHNSLGHLQIRVRWAPERAENSVVISGCSRVGLEGRGVVGRNLYLAIGAQVGVARAGCQAGLQRWASRVRGCWQAGRVLAGWQAGWQQAGSRLVAGWLAAGWQIGWQQAGGGRLLAGGQKDAAVVRAWWQQGRSRAAARWHQGSSRAVTENLT